MKKTLAILLALAMVFSTLTVAFAEGTIGADAQACATLGMLKGNTSAGVTADYVATPPTRIQAAILFLRLKGLEADALAFTGTDNFADANKEAWAKPIMAYLKAHPELGWVGDQGKFNPSEVIKAQDYYKVMLEALGYKQNSAAVIGDFVYADTLKFAAEHGLSKVATVTNFTVNDVAIATIEALKANVKGTEKTLAFSLVEAKVLTQDAAVAAGVYTAPVVALAVESVSATNLRQITVKFNKDVDEDTVLVGNFKVDSADAAAVALGDDNKTVTVTVASPAAVQPANYDITVANVKDLAGKAITKYETTLRVLDTAIPTITGISLTGPNTFVINFSEPINPATVATVPVKINNGVYAVSGVVVSGKKATVTLAATSLTEGNYTVKMEGFKDYAGFAIDATTMTLAYVKNVTKPVATIKSAKQTEVVVLFDRAVTLDGTYDADSNAATVDTYRDYFYHTFSTWRPDSVAVSADKTTYTLTFNTYPVPEGTSTLVVKAKGVAGVNAIDDWGNKLEENTNLALTVTADKTAPVVKEVKVASEDTVYIYFSEDMKSQNADHSDAGVLDETNFKFKDKDGKDVTTSFTNSYAYNSTTGEAKLTVKFASKLSGNYTVDMKGLEDKALTPNPLAAVTLAFTVTDLTAPTTAVTVNGLEKTAADDSDVIYVTYNEKMATTGENSVIKATNYLLAGADLPEDTTLEMFGTTGKVVKITIPSADKQTIVGAQLTIGRVADLAGNKLSALSFNNTVLSLGAPTVEAVKITDYNKATVVVSAPLSVVLASGFRTATNEIASIDSWSIDENSKTIINVTVNGADQAVPADTSSKLSKFYVAENILVAETGIKMASGDVSGLIKDYRAPKLVATDAIVATDNLVTITFTEALDNTYETLYAQDLVITDADGKVLVAGVDYTTTVSGSQLLVHKTVSTATKYTIKSVDTIKYIRDTAAGINNKANAFTTAKEITIQ